MTVTLTKIERRGGRTLWRKTMTDSGITRAMLRAFYASGIPRPLAETFRDTFDIPIEWWPKLLEVRHAGLVLTKRFGAVNLDHPAMMKKDHRLNIARAHAKSPFARHCLDAKGLSQADVAKKLRISKGRLSRYTSGNEPIPRAHADAIAELVKWPADKAHWPGGIS